jgi:hypothetical protein
MAFDMRPKAIHTLTKHSFLMRGKDKPTIQIGIWNMCPGVGFILRPNGSRT